MKNVNVRHNFPNDKVVEKYLPIYNEEIIKKYNNFIFSLTNPMQLPECFFNENEMEKLRKVPVYNKINSNIIKNYPIITKRDVSFNDDYCSDDEDITDIIEFHTSGSSGTPLVFWQHPCTVLEMLLLRYHKIVAIYGRNVWSNDLYGSLFITDNIEAGNAFFPDIFQKSKGFLRYAMSFQNNISDDLKLINKINASILSSKPNILNMLADLKLKGDLTIKPDLILSGGAVLTKELRHRIENIFECNIVSQYSMSEFGFIASERCDGVMQLDSSSLRAEILNPDENGQGELIITKVDKYMPFVRYNTKDIAKIENNEHAVLIKELVGRSIVLWEINGSKFSPTIFMHIFKNIKGLVEYQITKVDEGKFDVKVDISDEDYNVFIEYITDRFPNGCEISFHRENFTNDSKFQRFRTNL
ncbi:AMP-binding protein [Xenorhabdus miraniensis]|uniref:Uncharacterized protein n=1 Tax=Xenorhabdus miraniensis TaxID=351674 RepID=A0A2D0JWG3_9GAMM|nr:AMP-binding protein [Xenorhabdus miraniensis]PHM50721.1 hypothetical protein Xmir_00123 [Xenorhabdus miraniensis]